MDLVILYEDPHIIVVEKPSGMPSQKDPTGDLSILEMVQDHIKEQHPQVRNPYVGLVHRLDRPVGGVMVLAKTKEANQSLSAQIQSRDFDKKYWAVVCGRGQEGMQKLQDYLKRYPKQNISKVVSSDLPKAKEAILWYEKVEEVESKEGILSLLEVELRTGRHHQIRVQLSHAGLPIWGDTKYNPIFSKSREWVMIALWAGFLSFHHPKTKKKCTFQAPLPNRYPYSLFSQSSCL
ncbi:MAG: RluA family pseudouridine synthase [Epulopiscium sp.]|nr:RluA family pseudouridine synthase [Candidatus Epulonipiscium sp.]